jgi:tryptophan synthase alpha chain
VLGAVERIRARSELPIVIMAYANLVHRMGYERFARAATQAGVDGVIITDLPLEAAGTWIDACASEALATIFLAAPTSREETLRRVGASTTGFVYCVSRAGTTGARASIPEDLPEFLARVRAHTDRPVCVGFGISTPEQVAEVCRVADGAIIGSALIDRMAEAGPAGAARAAAEFCRALKAGAQGDA